MSHLALRRVMVRLLHDPTLVEAVYADAGRALAGVPLDAAERRWLAAVPHAAWGTDPQRPARVLAALADEFPATTGIASGRASSFFASPAFHRAVQDRGSLALAFGEHLGAAHDARVASLARLETAIAYVRRAARVPRPSHDGYLRRTPAAAVARVGPGTLACYQAIRAGRPPEAITAGDECLLVLRRGTGSEATVEEIPAALAGLLDAASVPQPRAALEKQARRLGADADEDAEIVDELVRDRLLL